MANITLLLNQSASCRKKLSTKIIRKANTDKHCKCHSTWSLFISMMFCLFSGCDSACDISNGLSSANGNLNRLGISRAPANSTVAY